MNKASLLGVGYRCTQCGKLFGTADAASSCLETPVIPLDTKYLTIANGHVMSSLFIVRSIEGTGCKQHVTLRPHPAFWSDMKHEFRGQKKGFSMLIMRSREHDEGMPVPLTSEMAQTAIATLERGIRQRELYLDQIKRRRRFFEHYAKAKNGRLEGDSGDLDDDDEEEDA